MQRVPQAFKVGKIQKSARLLPGSGESCQLGFQDQPAAFFGTLVHLGWAGSVAGATHIQAQSQRVGQHSTRVTRKMSCLQHPGPVMLFRPSGKQKAPIGQTPFWTFKQLGGPHL